MRDFTIKITTSLSDAFFFEDEDNNRFDEWFQYRLTDCGLFDWELEDLPQNIPGVRKLSASVNDFDYNHNLNINIYVDGGGNSLDDLADNDDLFNYIERKLVYRIIDELNKVCEDVSIPMNNGTFNDFKFDDNEFFAEIIHSPSLGYFISPNIKDSTFQIYPEFEVYV